MSDDSKMIRTRSEYELVISYPSVRRAYLSRFRNAFCIKNFNVSRSGFLPRFYQIPRLPRKVTFQNHQMLRLTRKKNFMIDGRYIWHVFCTARSNIFHPPVSPNTNLPRKITVRRITQIIWNGLYNTGNNRCHPLTLPNIVTATKNELYYWPTQYIKRHLQCAEQQDSPSNLFKYCACYVKWHAWLMPVTYATLFTMRGAIGITLQPHQILRLPRKITFQNLREICRRQFKRHLQWRAIRKWSEPDSTIVFGLCSDCRRIVFSIGGSNSRGFYWNLELTDFVAGAVFLEVGGWLCLLRVL